MSDQIDSLSALLQLCELSAEDPRPNGMGRTFAAPAGLSLNDRVFGGHMLAQAAAAAGSSLDDTWLCHSLHAYFVRPGLPGTPFHYHVDNVKSGRTFAVRRVSALQEGKERLQMMASFETAGLGP